MNHPPDPIPNQNPDSNPPASSSQQHEQDNISPTLQTKCRALLTELDTFQSHLTRTLRNPQVIEIRSLRSSVLAELRTLERLEKRAEAEAEVEASTSHDGHDHDHDGDGDGEGTSEGEDGGRRKERGAEARLAHTLRSSNLPFYEAVWGVAKGSCSGIASFGKRLYADGVGWDGTIKDEEGKKVHSNKGNKGNNIKDKRKSVYVDIVDDDGEEWVKVSTISESRLLFEMAKKGWEGEESDEEEEDRTVLRNVDGEDSEDDEDEIELIKLAADMKKVAGATRVRYRRPRIRFVIPKVEEGKDGDIDRLLKEIRSYGVTVECGSQVSAQGVCRDASELDLSHLLPNPFKRFTSTLNMDCTVLLAVVSDLSHFKSILPSSVHHPAINRQIEIDKQQPLLPTELWPAMGAHGLICTEEAEERMRQIVDTIGTDTERERMRILMGSSAFSDWDTASLVQKFQELSDYQVPTHWRLPVRVVEAMSVIDSARQGKLPPVANNVAKVLSDINYSVFIYGWSAGLTTITSNRTAAKQIETTIEKFRNGDEDLEGPPVWVCDTARSLIGKEKGRKF